MKKSIVVLSGGLDSTCALYRTLHESGFKSQNIKAISFNYGQKHKRELEKAKETCEKLDINHKIIDITCLKEILDNSSLVGTDEIPEGHYAEKSMKSTVVPNRNMIMASIAIAYAINNDYDEIVLGVHQGDHAIYPDCRPEFIGALRNIAKVCDYKQIEVTTPYLECSKIEIVKDGIQHGVDFSKTWTCYKGGERPCEKCGSCTERAEAFKENCFTDKLLNNE